MPPASVRRGRRKSTATSRPRVTSSPTSSRTSRRQPSHGVSPFAAMIPPGIVQCFLYVGFTMSNRPDPSKISAPADAGIRGSTNASPFPSSDMTAMVGGCAQRNPRHNGNVQVYADAWSP